MDFADLKAVYFRKTEKNEIGKKGQLQLKKIDRIFKTKHACMYCGKLVCKSVMNIEEKHSKEEEMKEICSLQKAKKWMQMLFCMLNINFHNRFVNSLL